MNMLATIAAVVLQLSAQIGVTAAQGGQAGAYLAQHPEPPAQARSAIESHQIAFGMTSEQVQASLGAPSHRRNFQNHTTTYRVWLYPIVKVIHNGARFVHPNQGLVRLVFVNDRLEIIDPLG